MEFRSPGYLALGTKPKEAALGNQIELSFFAYGNDDAATYGSMDRLVNNVRVALGSIDGRIAKDEHKRDRKVSGAGGAWKAEED